jgi:hypothetical protein
MIRIRNYKEEDYPALQAWFNSEKYKSWICPPADALSDLGLIVESQDHKLAAGFIYHTNSNWVSIEFVIVNPEAPKSLRVQAIDSLMEALFCQAEQYGKYLITSTANQFLGKRLQNTGFTKTDLVNHYIKIS